MKKQQSTLVEQLVDIFSHNNTNQIMLNYAIKNYQISLYKIKNFQPHQILTMYKGISLKSYHNPETYNEEFWLQNELKVYIWTLVAYSFQRQLRIQNFTCHEWLLFTQAFNNRPVDFFLFQAKCILKPNKLTKTWTNQQQELLRFIILKDSISNKWNFVARQLFKLSNTKYYKTPKQCRQRWLNHLDPTKKHSPWSLDQDIELFKCVSSIGKRWAQISKMFNNTRTEHTIKNRFKAIVYSFSKRYPKINEQEVVEKFLSSHYNQNKPFNQRKTQKKLKHKDKSIKKDPLYVCRVPKRNLPSQITFTEDKTFKTKPNLDIHITSPTDEQFSHNKQTKVCHSQIIIQEMVNLKEEKEEVLQFFQEMDSKMSNIPFEMQNEEIQSFISKCLQAPSDHFGEAKLNCHDMFSREGF